MVDPFINHNCLVMQVVIPSASLLLLLLAGLALQGRADPPQRLVAHELVRQQHQEASLQEQLQRTCNTVATE
jgi:hypothetical protein